MRALSLLVPVTALFLAAACTGSGGTIEPEGNVYTLSFDDAVVVDADDGASDLVRNATSGDILMQAVTATDDAISWRLAFGDADGQDMCSRTTDLPAATRADAGFTVGPAAVTFPSTPAWTMEGLTINGTLSEDFQSASEISMEGTLDAREIVELVPLFSTGEGICDALADYGMDCYDCGDGAGNYCVDLHVTGLTGSAVVVDVEAIIEDPLCE